MDAHRFFSTAAPIHTIHSSAQTSKLLTKLLMHKYDFDVYEIDDQSFRTLNSMVVVMNMRPPLFRDKDPDMKPASPVVGDVPSHHVQEANPVAASE